MRGLWAIRGQWNGVASLLLLCWLLCCVIADAPGKKAQVAPTKEDFLYLEKADPVIEFDVRKDPDYKFIYSSNNGPRVICFYMPFCPHCIGFRDSYVRLARRVNDVAHDMGVGPIQFYAVSCKVNRDLCKTRFHMTSYPRLRMYRQNDTANEYAVLDFHSLHTLYILNSLGVQLEKLPLGQDSDDDDKDRGGGSSLYQVAERSLRGLFHNRPAEGAGFRKRSKEQVFHDAYLSFAFSLRNEIFTEDGPLVPRKKLFFENWIIFLHKTLPSAWKIQRLLEAILGDFERVCTDEKVLLEIVDKFVPNPAPKWSPGCSGEVPGTAYTCGLWSLFHIAAAGVVEWNRHLPEGTSTKMALSAEEAGVTLRNYIAKFFGCEECRDHFVKAYDDCYLDRCKKLSSLPDMTHWKRFPRWLLEMHNAVNVRLLIEKAKREKKSVPTKEEQYTKLWPPPQDCPSCWGENRSLEAGPTDKYLRMEYWPEDSTTRMYRRDLGLDEASSAQDGLLSPPALLSIGLVIILFGFTVRRRMILGRTGYHKKVDL